MKRAAKSHSPRAAAAPSSAPASHAPPPGTATPLPLTLTPEGAVLEVKVQPKASATRIVGRYGQGIKVAVTAPPEDGKANAAVLALLAKAVGAAPSQLEIVAGHTNPNKRVRFGPAVSVEAVRRLA